MKILILDLGRNICLRKAKTMLEIVLLIFQKSKFCILEASKQ